MQYRIKDPFGCSIPVKCPICSGLEFGLGKSITVTDNGYPHTVEQYECGCCGHLIHFIYRLRWEDEPKRISKQL